MEPVIAPQYQSGGFFEHGYAVVTNNLRRRAIDVSGKVIIPLIYQELNYWPQHDWWLAKSYPDSLRIFCRKDGSDIYRGPGSLVLAYADLNRLVICSGTQSGDEMTRLLRLSGRRRCGVRRWRAAEGICPSEGRTLTFVLSGPR